jgi:hypothetical protein
MSVCAGEFEMIGRAVAPEHHPIEAVVILKAIEDAQPQAVTVEANDCFKVVARPRDTKGWRVGHGELLEFSASVAKRGDWSSDRLTSEFWQGDHLAG